MTDSASQTAGVEVAGPSRLRLFLVFLRLGLTAFGGPAVVAYIRDLAVKKKQWLSQEAFQDGAALCQSIPGATSMQTAAYVGLRAGGPLGALAAFVGFGLPAFVLMVAMSAAYQAGRDLQPVLAAFRGLNVIVIAIVANAVVNFGRSSVKNWRDALLAAGAAAFLVFRGSPILAILGAAGIGLFLYWGVRLPEAKQPRPPQIPMRRLVLWATLIALSVGACVATLFFLDQRLFGLATIMLKVDVFAFGGGFASVPLMLHEVVDVRHWLDSKTFMDGIALGQVTPGPVFITATFIGYKVLGVKGALAATFGVFTPSITLMIALSGLHAKVKKLKLVQAIVKGLLSGFIGLLVSVTLQFALKSLHSWQAWLIFIASLIIVLYYKKDILWAILGTVLFSILFV